MHPNLAGGGACLVSMETREPEASDGQSSRERRRSKLQGRQHLAQGRGHVRRSSGSDFLFLKKQQELGQADHASLPLSSTIGSSGDRHSFPRRQQSQLRAAISSDDLSSIDADDFDDNAVDFEDSGAATDTHDSFAGTALSRGPSGPRLSAANVRMRRSQLSSSSHTNLASSTRHRRARMSMFELSQSVESISDILASTTDTAWSTSGGSSSVSASMERLPPSLVAKTKGRRRSLNPLKDAVLYSADAVELEQATDAAGNAQGLRAVSMVSMADDRVGRFNALPDLPAASASATSARRRRQPPSQSDSGSDTELGSDTEPLTKSQEAVNAQTKRKKEPSHRFQRTRSGSLDVMATLAALEKTKLEPIHRRSSSHGNDLDFD